MTDNECPADSRRRHVLRLALFAGILLGLFYLVAVARVIHVDGVRSAIVVATVRSHPWRTLWCRPHSARCSSRARSSPPAAGCCSGRY
ncbi:hypothetical protein G7Z39_00395 [Mycobacterium tuberculosis]|nr:hypothetical protein [Mycobacterium tuberculosis]